MRTDRPAAAHRGTPRAGWACAHCGAPAAIAFRPRWFLVRHGETAWNREQRYLGHAAMPLTAAGRRHAEAVAALLLPQHVDLLVSSDLLRSRQTAEILAARLHVPIRWDPRLRERGLGDWESLTKEEVRRRYRGTGIDRYAPGYRMPGGETLDELRGRVGEALASYRRHYRRRAIVLVSHAGPLAALARMIAVGTTVSGALEFAHGHVYGLAPLALPCGCGGALCRLDLEADGSARRA